MGKPCLEETFEFGEVVNCKLGTDDLGDLGARWASGVWLGKRWKNIEHLVHTNGEVTKCRAVSRNPLEERWRLDAIESIVATPWIHRPHTDEGVREARVLPPLPNEQQPTSTAPTQRTLREVSPPTAHHKVGFEQMGLL